MKSAQRRTGLIIFGAIAAMLLFFDEARAQRSPADEVGYVIGLIENSPENALAEEFSSLYFDSGVHVFTDPRTSRTSDRVAQSLQSNAPALQRYLRSVCSRLNADEKWLLEAYAGFRYGVLARATRERRSALQLAMGEVAIVADPPVQINFADPCTDVAASGPDGIAISHSLVLAALFSVYFVDSHVLAVPKRALIEFDLIMPRVDRLDPEPADALLARLRAMPLYTHHLRALRSMGFGAPIDRDVSPEGLAAERTIPLDRVENEYYGRLCALADRNCAVTTRLSSLLLSMVKLKALFDEQVDFMLGHEIGHQALGHTQAPIGTCADELEREAAADRYAVGLIRPKAGLFTDPPLRENLKSIPLDFTIASGLQLFMVQTHRLAELTDGDSCAYPTFADRLGRARSFEQRAFAVEATPSR